MKGRTYSTTSELPTNIGSQKCIDAHKHTLGECQREKTKYVNNDAKL